MTAPNYIFLHTESAMRRELWRTFLSTPTQICLSDLDELSPQTDVEVVVTDQQMDEASLAKFATAGRIGDGSGDQPTVAARYDGSVITIGTADTDQSDVTPHDPIVGPASVSLPSDATARELKLAILLLTQIVRLNRAYGTRDQLSNQYQQLAFQDPLTSIANRRAWDQELKNRWENRFSAEGPMCLALFDVDQLKQVNDMLGHAEGDSVLRATADSLVASIRDLDFVARLGGDEFGVLLDDIDPNSAHRIIDRIRCSTSRFMATGEASEDLPVTTSAGYACLQADDTVDSLYRRADDALRASKQSGSNRTTGEG